MDTPTTLDSFEALCDYGRSISEDLDTRRWQLGDIANTVEERYGDKTIADFAREIGQRKSTCYQYAQCAKFYPPNLRRRLQEDMPTLTYSHMRDGLRLKDVGSAVTWLNEVASNGWTADEASFKLKEKLGNADKTVEYEGIIHKHYDERGGEYILVFINYADFKTDLEYGQKVTIRPK